ncbi:hypothetical protein PRZ48_012188 [Zasmidium cellare]|uniref:Uncharacterized protein n=1 Tax=Zasmidium cellare TaxID=395010 RepID=A0ABR0E4L3_ZASCE|nr:hypothetical protein PRZ48_012188 [Zasmidium cellare]
MSEPCLLLDKLPAELRNRVWEFAFAPDDDSEVELAEATPPSKNLLLTCRQIYDESYGLYQPAYRDYFRTTKFRITYQINRVGFTTYATSTFGNSPLLRYPRALVEQITRMTFVIERPHQRADDTLELVDKRGGWKWTSMPLPVDYLAVAFFTIARDNAGVWLSFARNRDVMEDRLAQATIATTFTRQLLMVESLLGDLY